MSILSEDGRGWVSELVQPEVPKGLNVSEIFSSQRTVKHDLNQIRSNTSLTPV